MGRPYIFNQAIADQLVAAVSDGLYYETCAALVGVSPQTLRNWIRWGKRGKTPELARFHDSLVKALAKSEQGALNEIKNSGQWQARAWFLERRFPERWARYQPINADLSKLTDEQLAEAAGRRSKKSKASSQTGIEEA